MPAIGGTAFQAAVQGVRHVAELDHLWHVNSIVACATHVKTELQMSFSVARKSEFRFVATGYFREGNSPPGLFTGKAGCI